MIGARQKKLYSKIQNINLPESILEFRGGGAYTYRIDHQVIPVAAYVTWPSGRPCLAVNMYLLDKSWKLTGESAVTESSKLTELIRYCATGRVGGNPIRFSELNDGDIGSLIRKLCNDVSPHDSTVRVRNNNTVRSIMHSVFNFLSWYQDNLIFDGFRLIGLRSEGAAIIIEQKLNSRSNKYYFSHRYLPPSESTDPKLPMGTLIVEAIEGAIEDLERPELYSDAVLRKFGNDEQYFLAHLEYLTARRTFMLFLMKATGLRPAEMVSMSLDENTRSIYGDPPVLILPNLKQRRHTPSARRLQITEKQAMRVRLYLRARDGWLKFLKSKHSGSQLPNSIFVSAVTAGMAKPVSKSALEKDFEKLCNKAGYRDQQTCFSMFRHRFITDQLSMHLKAFDQQVGTLNKYDYRTVLEKVREKTGHRSIDSLWHYIDLVRDLSGVWESVGKNENSIEVDEDVLHQLRGLKSEIKEGSLSQMSAEQLAEYISSKLDTIIDG